MATNRVNEILKNRICEKHDVLKKQGEELFQILDSIKVEVQLLLQNAHDKVNEVLQESSKSKFKEKASSCIVTLEQDHMALEIRKCRLSKICEDDCSSESSDDEESQKRRSRDKSVGAKETSLDQPAKTSPQDQNQAEEELMTIAQSDDIESSRKSMTTDVKIERTSPVIASGVPNMSSVPNISSQQIPVYSSVSTHLHTTAPITLTTPSVTAPISSLDPSVLGQQQHGVPLFRTDFPNVNMPPPQYNKLYMLPTGQVVIPRVAPAQMYPHVLPASKSMPASTYMSRQQHIPYVQTAAPGPYLPQYTGYPVPVIVSGSQLPMPPVVTDAGIKSPEDTLLLTSAENTPASIADLPIHTEPDKSSPSITSTSVEPVQSTSSNRDLQIAVTENEAASAHHSVQNLITGKECIKSDPKLLSCTSYSTQRTEETTSVQTNTSSDVRKKRIRKKKKVPTATLR